jgi:hypothetical protein
MKIISVNTTVLNSTCPYKMLYVLIRMEYHQGQVNEKEIWCKINLTHLNCVSKKFLYIVALLQ